jgi:hypothetical protein
VVPLGAPPTWRRTMAPLKGFTSTVVAPISKPLTPTFAYTQISGIDLNLTRYDKKWFEGVI